MEDKNLKYFYENLQFFIFYQKHFSEFFPV